MNNKSVEKFKAFLIERGAEILKPTNPWEVVRFSANGLVSIIYRNKRGDNTFVGDAEAALDAFRSGGKLAWTSGNRTGRSRNLSVKLRTVVERDGRECFYCLTEVTDEHASAEHLVPLAHGGGNHISNLVLAHQRCNQEASHKHVIAKIRMREDAMRTRLWNAK